MNTTLFDVPALYSSRPAPEVSDRYRFYPTHELIQPLLADGWQITTAFQVLPRRGGASPYAKHLVRLTHPKLQLGADRLEALIRNSHDARSRFEFMLGAWRCVCANGLILGEAYANVNIQHRRAFEAVQEQAQKLIERAPEVAEVFEAWKGRELNIHEQYYLANVGRRLRWGELAAAPVEADALLSVRRDEDKGIDLWTTFNRIQENLMRGGIEHKVDRRPVRAIRSIDETVRINKALWRAAASLYAGNSDLALPA